MCLRGLKCEVHQCTGDHKSLLKVRSELFEEMYAEDSAVGEEFTEICGSHSDYMWDVMGAIREP